MSLSIWTLVLYSGFPPFFACLLLLVSPKFLRKPLYKALHFVFFFRIRGYPMIYMFVFGEGGLFITLARETYLKWAEQQSHKSQGTVPIQSADMLSPVNQYTCKLWRGQRNCYATAWALTSWWLLTVAMTYEEERQRLMDQMDKQKTGEDAVISSTAKKQQ